MIGLASRSIHPMETDAAPSTDKHPCGGCGMHHLARAGITHVPSIAGLEVMVLPDILGQHNCIIVSFGDESAAK